MKEYAIISFGEHKGKPVNEVPMDYLMWLFPKLQNFKQHRLLYFSILDFFLTKEVVVDRGRFYFEYYDFMAPGGEKLPFLVTLPLKNSKGENVFVAGNLEYPTFIQKVDKKFEIVHGYSTLPHKYGVSRMVVEHNPNYFFRDSEGNLYNGVYLMKEPNIPEKVDITFTENQLVTNLK